MFLPLELPGRPTRHGKSGGWDGLLAKVRSQAISPAIREDDFRYVEPQSKAQKIGCRGD